MPALAPKPRARGLMLLLALLGSAGCTRLAHAPRASGLRSDLPVEPPQTTMPSTAARPPIDLRAPRHLETATFALG